MIWQDYIFTAASVFFALALLPLVRDPLSRVPRATSIPTAVFIAMLAATQATMGLIVAPVFEAITAAGWAYIAWRRAPTDFDLFRERVLRR